MSDATRAPEPASVPPGPVRCGSCHRRWAVGGPFCLLCQVLFQLELCLRALALRLWRIPG